MTSTSPAPSIMARVADRRARLMAWTVSEAAVSCEWHQTTTAAGRQAQAGGVGMLKGHTVCAGPLTSTHCADSLLRRRLQVLDTDPAASHNPPQSKRHTRLPTFLDGTSVRILCVPRDSKVRQREPHRLPTDWVRHNRGCHMRRHQRVTLLPLNHKP